MPAPRKRAVVLKALLPLPLLLLGVFLALPARAAPDDPGAPPREERERGTSGVSQVAVEFTAGERTVRGAVLAPEGTEDQHPGVVLVAGSGAGVPMETYLPVAEAFAAAGVVALVYDKRGEADGDGLSEASLPDLADDAVAGVRLLRERPDVRSDLVGVHGHSEGGWTVIEAGVRSAEVDFVVAAAPSALPPDRTQIWMNQVQLRHAGVSDRLLDDLGGRLTRHVVGADAFRLAGHDPLPDLARLEQPFLGVIAEHDRSTPPGQTLELYRDTLEGSGHPHHTLRVVPGVGHGMKPSPDGFVEGVADPDALFEGLAPEYVDTVTGWVHGLAAGDPGGGSDAPPAQDLESLQQPPAGPGALWFLAATGGGSLVCFSAYLGIGLIARVRGNRGQGRSRSPVAGARGALAVLGLSLPPLTMSYLGWIMMTAGTEVGTVVLGRPLPWLGLQVGALAALGATAVLLLAWWNRPDPLTGVDRVRLGLLLVGAATLLSWAVTWGLLTP
ncbi:alpha/beta hydrolase [Nocardiopsis sp. NPDC006832]|uniref:alpha/beta hydrolase n=1 Tax=Nocardiopsis sp. NPDC006832 TaxID=3157188 RepID=UPI0033F42F40